MRKLFTILLFFVFDKLPAQSIDKIIQTNIETTVDKKIAVFSSTLDSILVKETTRTGTFNIDTIRIPVGGSGLYQLSIKGNYGTFMASGIKYIAARNDNGIYTIKRTADYFAYAGITGHKWDVVVVNNFLVVKITSVVAYTVKWEYRRMNL